MHFAAEMLLVVLAAAGTLGILWISRVRVTKKGRRTLHYALALVAWVSVWFFTHVVWYWLQSWLGHDTAIGYPGWFWLILLIGVALVFVPKTANVVRFVGAALVVITLFFVNWFGPVSGSGLKSSLDAAFHTKVSGLRVNVDASSSQGDINHYTWGVEETNAVAHINQNGVKSSIVFKKAGTFHIDLTVMNKNDKQDDTTKSVTVKASQAAPYHQRSASQCTGGFNVKYDPNKGDDDVTGGVDTVNVTKGINQVLNVAKHDPRYLFKLVESSPLGKQRFPQLKNYKQLQGAGVNDGCYSSFGRDAFNTLQGQLYSPHTKVAPVKQAPSGGRNSGTHANGSPYMEQPAVLIGDKRAIKVTYANGQVVYILHRCGNVYVVGGPVPNVSVKPSVPKKCMPSSGNHNCGVCMGSGCNGSPPKKCVPKSGVESCGKHASYRPRPFGGDVKVAPKGGYIDRGGHPHSSAYVPPKNHGTGKGDSGRGAVNTTTAPKPSSTATVPNTAAPTKAPPSVPGAGG